MIHTSIMPKKLGIIDSYKYNVKKTWDVINEIIGDKRVTNAPLPNFVTVKNREIFDKKEIAETFNNFQNYIHYDGPCLSTMNLTDLELENSFGSLEPNKS